MEEMGGPAFRGGHRLCRETPVAQRLIASTDVAPSEYQQSRPPSFVFSFSKLPRPQARTHQSRVVGRG
jgi:hypothetical protein